MPRQEETVCVFTLKGGEESSLPLIEAEFEKAGIAMQVRSHHEHAYDGLFIGQKGSVDIYVFKKDKQKALAILTHLLE